jgi:hypothetical protein
MPPLEAKRTLVKSPPELWAEVSDAGALARHLGEFGDIRITRTQPEEVVEWEGDRASGSVRLEPSGWGTRVTLTAEPALTTGSGLAFQQTEIRDDGTQDLTPSRWWQRMFRRRAPETEPEAVPEPEPVPAVAEDEAVAALTGVLDTLGSANHRPFSR